ncbi:MAG: xerD [Acidimicrobiales bacterium]|nr:xerD [Acidimicrobiales bacterium]
MTRRSFGALRKLPSGRWQASYTDEHTGERIAAPGTFGSKADANLWLSTVVIDRARGWLPNVALAQRPFEAWAAEWLAGVHVKAKTEVSYECSLRNHVLPAFTGRPVVSITYRDCKQFVADLTARGLAAGTIGEARKVLRMVLQEALRADAISRNPADGLRVPRGERQEMVFLDPDQIFTLADQVANPPRPKRHPQLHHPEYGLLVRFAAFTGLRAGEIGALRVGRVAPDGSWVEVAESVAEVHGELLYGPPKTYSRRRVDVPEGLADELAALRHSRPDGDDEFVFTSPTGGPLRHTHFYARFYRPAVARAGLDPRTRFHDLRHTAAALMIAQGAHLLVVKERLGHSSISVTADRYGHLYPSLSASLTAQLGGVYRAGAIAARYKP